MIKFSCNNCGRKMGVKDELAGKRGKCPECRSFVVVPEQTVLVNLECDNCGEGISAPSTRAGKEGRCPKCKHRLVIPVGHNLTLLDVSEEYKLRDQETSRPAPPDELFEQEKKSEETESDNERKLPWIVDIFLYPTSRPGLTHLAIFIGIPFLIHLIRQLLGPLAVILLFPAMVLNFLLGFYVCWYFAECVRDSAAGRIRAPEAFADADIGSMFEQWLYLAACYAIFALPAVLYFTYTNRTDGIFWGLVAYGVFFFPMGLLAVVIFDSSSAFNPFLWISSIFKTFFRYCGLVLAIAGIVLAFSFLIGLGEPQEAEQTSIVTEILGAVFACLLLYVVFVVAHLLGRFYWRYEEKLNW
jgi:DNA-directed RNA polymerase subunit RPC12/RpoP